jgi:hypothetical protein
MSIHTAAGVLLDAKGASFAAGAAVLRRWSLTGEPRSYLCLPTLLVFCFGALMVKVLLATAVDRSAIGEHDPLRGETATAAIVSC